MDKLTKTPISEQFRIQVHADFGARYSGILRPQELLANTAEFERFCNDFRDRRHSKATNAMIREALQTSV